MRQQLEVWCFDRLAGQLIEDDEGLAFAYDPEWIAAGNPPLSQSLPLDGELSGREVKAFFGGLLPEGELRKLLALELGVSDENDFSILEHVGGDCAGAISLYVPGWVPHDPGGSVDWLSDAEVASLVGELPRRPMYAGPDDEYRLSLAGAQNKLPVVVGDGWRIGLPREGRPSTHILKIPIADLRATVLNEAFCLCLGSRLGLDCATVVPRRVDGVEMLLVERYDRAERGGETVRCTRRISARRCRSRARASTRARAAPVSSLASTCSAASRRRRRATCRGSSMPGLSPS